MHRGNKGNFVAGSAKIKYNSDFCLWHVGYNVWMSPLVLYHLKAQFYTTMPSLEMMVKILSNICV